MEIEKLEEAIAVLQRSVERINEPAGGFVLLYPDDAKILSDFLSAMEWRNIYDLKGDKLSIGYKTFKAAKDNGSKFSTYMGTIAVIIPPKG